MSKSVIAVVDGRGLRTFTASLALGAVGVVGLVVVGTPAAASTGGDAGAVAAEAEVVELTLNASTNDEGELGDEVDTLDGLVLIGGGLINSGFVDAPTEPTGHEQDAEPAVGVPGVVNVDTLAADTFRTDDGLDATSSVASSQVTLGGIDILSTGLVKSTSSITVDGDPSATASVESLSIGGMPFEIMLDVPIVHQITLNQNEVFALLEQLNVDLNGFDPTLGGGSITVGVESDAGTFVDPDGAAAVGLDIHIEVDLHVRLAPQGGPAGAFLELNVAGDLLDMLLASTVVLRPSAATEPTTTTSTVPGDECVEAITDPTTPVDPPFTTDAPASTEGPSSNEAPPTTDDAVLPTTTEPTTTTTEASTTPTTEDPRVAPVDDPTTVTTDEPTAPSAAGFRAAPSGAPDPCEGTTPTTVTGGGGGDGGVPFGGGATLPETGPSTAVDIAITGIVLLVAGLVMTVMFRSRRGATASRP